MKAKQNKPKKSIKEQVQQGEEFLRVLDLLDEEVEDKSYYPTTRSYRETIDKEYNGR